MIQMQCWMSWKQHVKSVIRVQMDFGMDAIRYRSQPKAMQHAMALFKNL